MKGLRKDKTNVLYSYSQVCHLAATAAVEFVGQGYSVMELDGGCVGGRTATLLSKHEEGVRLQVSDHLNSIFSVVGLDSPDRKECHMDISTQATDQPVLNHIQELIKEEHRLFEQGERTPLAETDRQKLAKVQVELDQCWDLLRQRRALRDAGRDPDMARVRSAQVVEKYEQ